MKKRILLMSLCAVLYSTVQAQVVRDTVSVGFPGYPNQVWYSLLNDEQGSALKNNWDIAFDASGFGSSIHINSVTGTVLWKHPAAIADSANWVNLDTTGISAWPKLYNSDTTWTLGAFDQNINASNPLDLGWGLYSTTTHIVSGDSLHIIKLANGEYKKLWIKSLASGIFTFRYADLNGNNDTTMTLAKSTFTNKNFGYFSIQNDSALNREPNKQIWDLLFTQYTTFLPSFGAYTVTGVLHNNGVQVAKIDTVGNAATYTNYAVHTYTNRINELGYDWKTFAGGNYVMEDSLVYFVKRDTGNQVWKIIFTGFGGGANGNFMFSKELLYATGLNDETGNNTAGLTVYPNPSNGENVTIIYNFENPVSSATLNIYDLSGRIVYTTNLTEQAGMYTRTVDTSSLTSGMYIVSVAVDGKVMNQKLIIQ